MSAAPLVTPEACRRSVRRALAERAGIRTELRFSDAAGYEHAIRSVPVRGGRFLYDASEPWGLRAIGLCRPDGGAELEALCSDYAMQCAEECEPCVRELRLSDILRRERAGAEEEA